MPDEKSGEIVRLRAALARSAQILSGPPYSRRNLHDLAAALGEGQDLTAYNAMAVARRRRPFLNRAF
jgi:hypothetical protein